MPLVQWYMETTCCGKKYMLTEEVEKQIENGSKTQVSLDELNEMEQKPMTAGTADLPSTFCFEKTEKEKAKISLQTARGMI